MKTSKAWHGIRLHWVEAASDPDEATVQVLLPASWDEAAAAAFAQMALPGARRISLPERADRWISRAAQRAESAGLGSAPKVSARLHDLLIRRQGAPGFSTWAEAPHEPAAPPRFIFNLPAFHDPATGFDHEAFAQAVEWGTLALALLHPQAHSLAVGFADLDGLLARLGLAYDSAKAQHFAAALATLLRGRAECASARLSHATGPQVLPDVWSCPDLSDIPPLLAEAAEDAFHSAAHLGNCAHGQVAALTSADMAEALLGVETTGFAPAFARVSASGRLTGAARALLETRGLSAEAALSALLTGENPLALPGAEAAAAMYAALSPVLPLPALPKRRAEDRKKAPAALSPLVAQAMDLPRRRSGTMQKVSVGGHRLYLQTAEYENGTLGEISITLQRETPAYRALMDAFATAVSIGLQHGVPLDPFIEAFVGTRFGAAGPVEGDGSIGAATSIVDYVFRHLAESQLGRILPEPDAADLYHSVSNHDMAPTLPLDLPQDTPETRRRRFRLVG